MRSGDPDRSIVVLLECMEREIGIVRGIASIGIYQEHLPDMLGVKK